VAALTLAAIEFSDVRGIGHGRFVMVLVSRDRCLVCGKRFVTPLGPAPTPCPFCGSRIQFLDADRNPALVINPPLNFHGADATRSILESLPSIVGQGASVIFDYSNGSFLSSSAIGELLVLRKTMNRSGAQIKLVLDTGKPGVRLFLSQTHLDRLFPICSTVDEALQAP
jgi:anti-anti-sigma regulatory factor